MLDKLRHEVVNHYCAGMNYFYMISIGGGKT